MNMFCLRMRWFALGLLLLHSLLVVWAVPAVAAKGGDKGHVVEGGALTAERARQLLDAGKAELARIPGDAAPDTIEGQRKTAWQRRTSLMEEFLGLLDAQRNWTEQHSALPVRQTGVIAALKKFTTLAAPEIPTQIDKAAYVLLEQQRGEDQAKLSLLQTAQTARRQRLETLLPQLIAEARNRGEEALKREAMLNQATRPGNEIEQRLLEVQLENVRLNRAVAQKAQVVLESEAKYMAAAEAIQSKELDLAEKQVAMLEQQFAAYSKMLGDVLSREREQAQEELQRKEQAVEEAKTPVEHFIAEWEAGIARSESGRQDAQAQLVNLKKDVSDMEKRLASEKDEQIALKDLIDRAGTTGVAGDRVKLTLQQIRKRRKLLDRMLQSGPIRNLNEYRSRRFIIEDSLLGLTERFDAERTAISTSLSQPEQGAFLVQTDLLFERYRTTIRDEKAVLTEVIGLVQQMQVLSIQRLDTLNDLQRFIRTRAFWLRDGKPLSPQMAGTWMEEVRALTRWVYGLFTAEMYLRLKEVVATPSAILYILVLFTALPAALYYARQRIRAVTRAVNDRVVAQGRQLRLLLLVMLTGIVSATLLPAYLFVAARLFELAKLPASIGTVVAISLDRLALFLLLWYFFRSFFAQRSIAEVQFGMPRAAANAFYAAVRWLLFGYLLWLAPWQLLQQPPFEFEVMTRLYYILFLVTAAVGIMHLVKAESPYTQYNLELIGARWITHNWGLIARAIYLLLGVVLLLDLVGYRYASRSIIESLAATLALLIVAPPLYRYLLNTTQAISQRFAQPSGSEITGEESELQSELVLRTQHYVRLFFIVIAALLLLGFWGIDEQTLLALNDMRLYSVRVAGAETEFVTAADLVRCLLYFVVTFWILRALPGLYEIAIFPRLRLDEGAKYAMLTISRYTIFVVGFFMALSEIHLDLGRLGWLMAAIGVGLGFGLQEIVSNFVSGIILLIERPVRPGDTVTIGDMSGTVQRINIRATTILNFDRREVIVPNRTLITSNVTNWTRSDTINRLVVSIGVAYGSDVDRVSELLLEIAAEQPEALTDPAPSVIFMQHGESALDFDLRLFVPGPSDIMPVRDHLNKLINKRLAAEGIEIPFPQRDIHIRSSNVSAGIA